MRHSATKHPKGLDSRNPLVFDTRDLGPGSARTLTRIVPAPEYLGVEMARVLPGAELELEVQLEGVTEGVLVTATVSGPLAGECARCLEPFTSATKVRFQELFVSPENAVPGTAGLQDEADSYQLDASGLLDLEPALRDAVVLELPLSPLCDARLPGAVLRVRRPDGRRRAGPRARAAERALGCAEGLSDGGAGRLAARGGRSTGRESRTAMTTYRTDPAPGQAKEQ